MAMPSPASTRSNPRLDIEVATTRFPGSFPALFRKRAAASRIPSPLIIFPDAETNNARSASPSNATPNAAFSAGTRACIFSRCSEPHPALIFLPSGAFPIATTSQPRERNNSGPSRYAAPFAQSRTIRKPFRFAPSSTRLRRKSRYSACSDSSATSGAPAGLAAACKNPAICASISSSTASGNFIPACENSFTPLS